MKLSNVEVDPRFIDEGDWVSWPEHPEVYVKVRPEENKEYRNAINMELRKANRKYRNQVVPVNIVDSIEARLMVDHLIVDLSGLEDESDKEIKYDRDFGISIMTNPKFYKMRDFIKWAIRVVGEDSEEEMEADSKNSGSSSSGKRAGAANT